MIPLIRKRHQGPAWVVVTELPNGTGAVASRRADAVAIGLWPSHGFRIVGYEVKVSRGDVQKELKNPKKADAVGKFCDEWWLVVNDVKIIDGLVLPETWGVLAPKDQVLRIVKKAPKLTPEPINRAFNAAIIRTVCESWVPRAEHQALREELNTKVAERAAQERARAKDDAGYALEQLKQMVASFEAKAGVSLNQYNAGRVGEAVKIVMDNYSAIGEERMSRAIYQLDAVAKQYEQLAESAREGLKALRSLVSKEGPSA